MNATAAQVAKHLDLSRRRVEQLLHEGVLKRTAADNLDLDTCRVAYIRFLRDEGNRLTRSAAAARTQQLKVRQLEITIAREEGRLISLENVELVFEDLLAAFVAELRGVAAAATRDLQLREAIDVKLDAALDRCRRRFEKESAALARGSAGVEDDTPDAA